MNFLRVVSGAVLSVFLLSGFAEAGPALVGGYRPAEVANEDVVAAAKFAVQEHAKTEPTALIKILSAQSQIVAGRNFRVRLEVKQGPVSRIAVAVVYCDLQSRMKLTDWSWAVGDGQGGEANKEK